MSTIFEQPKHLFVFQRQQVIHALKPLLISFNIFMPAMMLSGFWFKAKAGQHIFVSQWIIGATIGLIATGLMRIALHFSFRRRYLEFREGGIFLSGYRLIAPHRFVSWSFKPISIEPRYTELRMSYKQMLGQKRWSMLMDDEAQISELKKALASQIPQAEAP